MQLLKGTLRSLQSTVLAARPSGASSVVAPTLTPVTGFPTGSGYSRQGGSAGTVSNSGDTRLALARLKEEAWYYLRMAVAPSTACSYSSAQQRYQLFCVRFSLPPLPATEHVLILFVAELAQSVCHATIHSYLSAVRNLHTIEGYQDPVAGSTRLEMVLRGVQRAKAHPGKMKLPVTPLILHRIREDLQGGHEKEDARMLRAACCLAFFCFMRVAEFTIDRAGQFYARVHLTPYDISLDSQERPTLTQVRIKSSKTDQFHMGTSVFLAATGTGLCPVSAVLCYLAERPRARGPMFLLGSREPLMRVKFVTLFRRVLNTDGIQANAFTGHSFRIGAATTAAAKGVPDNIIKALRRWTSEAYQVYIWLPRERLAVLSQTLTQE